MNDPDEGEERLEAEEAEVSETEETPRRGRRRKRKAQRKDRLIQTRVPEDLESALKAEAHRRRLTVSHLIRNMLEDTFDLVDGVVEDVDQLVGDSMDLAFQVGEDAQKIAKIAKRSADRFRAKREPAEVEIAPVSLDHVLAWNEVLLNHDAVCARCQAPLAKGSSSFLGLSQDPSKPPAWLCPACASAL